MGKRSLAIVGTQENYFAEIYDANVGSDPSLVSDCASPEDAATTYFSDIVQNSNGLMRSAAIAVWQGAWSPEKMMIFDAAALMTPCTEPDAEPGEHDIFLDVQLRS
ncbi:hypothetical protein BH10PSE12_BH10PSE12_07590 [soil metagenome]